MMIMIVLCLPLTVVVDRLMRGTLGLAVGAASSVAYLLLFLSSPSTETLACLKTAPFIFDYHVLAQLTLISFEQGILSYG